MDWKGRLRIVGFDGLLIVLAIVALIARQPAMLITVSILGLIPVAKSAIISIQNKSLTIDLLASVALLFSFLSNQWYSAAFIVLMLAFARIFDNWTKVKTKDIISKLLKYRPEKVKLSRDGKTIERYIQDVHVGDLVLVETGERIPVDGSVSAGQASVDESNLTGESLPVLKKINDKVFSSTLNMSGTLEVKVEKVGKDSTLEKIIALVDEASRKKSKTEQIAGKFTSWYILITFGLAVGVYLFTRDLTMVLAVLLVVCADDIAVAIPLSFTSAIMKGASRGIVVKGSQTIENLNRISIFITDKTGTLTKGKPAIVEIKNFSKIPQKKLLYYLGSAVAVSDHPIDEAIEHYLEKENIKIVTPNKFNEVPGEGVVVTLDNKEIIVGRIELLKEHLVKMTHEIKSEGYGMTAIAIDKKLVGLVLFEDEIRPFAMRIVADTKRLGVKKWVILTGDNAVVAKRVAQVVQVDEYKAGLKPEEKLVEIERYKKQTTGALAMIGDGVNDAASLAMADVSFAMGAIGSDAAIEAADIALMRDRLERIPEAMILAKKTQRVVKECFAIWAVTNSVGLILVLTGILDPMGAAAFNFITDFFPIFNALKINTFTLAVPRPE